jgi:hypothetical protein
MFKLLFLLGCIAVGFYLYDNYLATRAPAPRLAPTGSAFTMERASAESETGLVGIPAGAELKVLSRGVSESTVEYRGHTLNLPNTSLTRDLDAVDAIRRDEAQKRKKEAGQLPPPSDTQTKVNPRLERLSEDLVRVQDRAGDINYRLKKIAVSLEEERQLGKAETVSSHGLKTQQRTLQLELDRLAADEERLRDLIRREKRSSNADK